MVQAQCDVVQSQVTTDNGEGYLEINDTSDVQSINVVTNSTAQAEYVYMLTNSSFDILEFQDGPTATFDLCPYDADKYFIWGMSYTGDINLEEGDLVFTGSFSTGCFLISLTAVVIQKNVDSGGNCTSDPCDDILAGNISFAGGGTDTTFTIDNMPDTLVFTTSANTANYDFTYVLVDSSGNILSFLGGDTLVVNDSLANTSFIYAIAYNGNLSAVVGDSISGTLGDSCFNLSTNFITINQMMDTTGGNFKAQLFVSSNTQAFIAAYNIYTDSITMDSFPSLGMDADGIYYNQDDDVLYQLNRSANVINLYTNVASNLSGGLNPTLTATSTSDFINGREIAVSGDLLVVAQDADSSNNNQNRFIIYQISPNSITFLKAYDTNINLWGITINGSTLYTVQDNSGNLAVFENFFTMPSGLITPTNIVAIEGLVRTHGLTYNADSDLMLMTDIGSAGNADDGAIVVINDFMDAIADGMVDSTEQMRIAGDSTFLGNPVDVAYDPDSMDIYVAERLNGGGRVLCFSMPDSSGNYAPDYNDMFAGASALDISSENDFNLCDRVFAGNLSLDGGAVDTTVVVDSLADVLTFISDIDTGGLGFSLSYIVTDTFGNIVDFPMSDTFDFNNVNPGTYYVNIFAYTGNISAQIGDPIDSVDLSDDCFDLSIGNITVTVMPDTSGFNVVGQFFVSSGTQPWVGVYHIYGNGDIENDSFPSVASDADGIYFDISEDILYQLNRTDNVINVYEDVNASLGMGNDPMMVQTSGSDFTNGREIAISGNKLVVVQDAAASNGDEDLLMLYEISAMGFELKKTFEPGFPLWGIAINGGTLYAVEDMSSNVAVYENFFNQPEGPISATNMVTVEGLTRTHGITYAADGDRLILTDIGDAGNPGDGAFIIIKDFETVMANGFIPLSDQIRVEGPMSMLGNPVDIAIDDERNMIYVAERANGGGQVLGFSIPTASGDYAPDYSDDFAGVSAIHFPSEGQDSLNTVSQLFVSSNTQANVGLFNIKDNAQLVASSFPSVANDADGIYYDEDTDKLYQLNRTGNMLNVYSNVNASLSAGSDPVMTASSTSDFTNGREIAVGEDHIVVVQDADSSNSNTNAFYIYEKASLNLVKIYETGFNLWGIHLDTSTLYAVEDNSNRVAIYEDFFSQAAGMIAPTQVVEIEGLTRTHGITYYAKDDVLFLTDIGDAGNPNDGAIVTIWNFEAVSGDGVVDIDEQVRIEGASTMLGNPVDIALDRDAMIIYVAERANAGGQILSFGMPVNSGDYAPMYSAMFAGASAVHLSGGEDMNFTGNSEESWYKGQPQVNAYVTPINHTLKVFPNPVSTTIHLEWEQTTADLDSEATVRIIDNQGREFRREQTAVVQGTNSLNIFIEDLRAGMYHVFVTGQGVTQHQRFVKE
jgi:hypothetical protein